MALSSYCWADQDDDCEDPACTCDCHDDDYGDEDDE